MINDSTINATTVPKSRHPKALPFLFLTEMWERYGFYVVQGLIVLFLTKSYGFSDEKAFSIAGLYSALAYISPMAGGFVADRLLGFKTAILWGSVLLILGYALLALPFTEIFYFALATIIVGNGLFKPNISSLLGALYAPGDTARDTGFTIFYIGINLGILLAGLGSGFLREYYGWHVAFGSASIGLMLGFIIFNIGVHLGYIRYQTTTPHQPNRWLKKNLLIVYCVIAIFVLHFLLQSVFLAKWLLPTVGIILIFFIFYLAFKQTIENRNHLILLNVLIISSVVFWTLYLQMFFAANLFIDRLVDKNIFGINIPTTVFYALESIFVILLGPLFAWLWHKLNEKNLNPSPLIKFILGILFAGLGCLAIAVSTYFPDNLHLINPLWIGLSYLLITIGELLLSPIGLSAVTLLSPPHLTGMMMGVWFVALGFGGQFAGQLAKLASIPEGMTDAGQQLLIYRSAFYDFSYIAIIVIVLLYILRGLALRRLS